MELSGSFIAGVDALGSALLHFFWQGAVLALVYAALRPVCASVGARYRLGMGMLCVLALCPLLTLAYVWPSDPSAPSATAAALSPLFGDSMDAVASDAQAATFNLREFLPALVAVWIFGVMVIASRSLWHWRRLVRLVRGAAAPGAEWQVRLERMRRRFGLLRPVRLLVSAKVATPMLIGWIKPVVLLPLSMLSGFSPHQIELIIAHELGHVRRWDYLANLFQVVVETVLFYHPVVHWISRDVRNARESCCDDLVLSLADGNPLAYARTLADLEELRHDLDVVAPALGASGGVLLARIRRIVGVQGHDPLPRNATWPLLLAAAALLFFAMRPPQSLPDIAAALARLPADSLALVSGNPRLTVPYEAPRLTTPMPELTLQASADASAPDALDAPLPVRIAVDRPRIDKVAFAGSAAAAVHDIVATQALPALAPSLEPAALTVAQDAPARLHVVAPVYPPRAMSSGVEGNVELEYSIAADGSVHDIRVLRAQPQGVFDASAQNALSLWQFVHPSAEAVMTRFTQNFAFTLHGKPASTDNSPKCQISIGSLICRRLDERGMPSTD
jgi:bla regulator protein BlaR1